MQRPSQSQPNNSFQPSQPNDSQFETANLALHRQQQTVCITTGSRDVDAMLGGGIRCGQITEIFGPPKIGKSQMCYTLSITAQLPQELNGAFGKTLYIDANNTFNAQRLSDIADRFNIDQAIALDNVICTKHVSNMSQLLDKAEKLLNQSRYALIVVDGTDSLFKTEFPGPVKRAQEMTAMMERLQHLARRYDVAVVITNKIMENTREPQTDVIGQFSSTRIRLREGQRNRKICVLDKSPNFFESIESIFEINLHGVVDI